MSIGQVDTIGVVEGAIILLLGLMITAAFIKRT